MKETRPERTRRLVQIGATIEKHLQINTPQKAEALGRILTSDQRLWADLVKKIDIKT